MSAALLATFALSFGALKVGLVSGMGIVCGWQPMPDGSQSYECVVQLEPELVDSLKHGASIPLAVEIPEHVRPISRIRITVGEGTLPQQALVTNLKPWPADQKHARDGVVETQYTTNNNAANNGYGYQQPVNGQITPINGPISNSQDAFARSLQSGGQAVRNAAGQVAQDVLPPEPGRNLGTAVDRAGQELGNNLRSASETVRDDIRQLFGTEPVAGNTQNPGGNSDILPPGSVNTPAYQNPQSQQILPADSGPTANGRRRLDQPISSNQVGDWQSSMPATNSANNPLGTNANNQNGAANSQWPEVPAPQQQNNPNVASGDRYGPAPAFSTSNSNILPQNNVPQNSGSQNTQRDQYGNVLQPQSGGLSTADNRNGQTANDQAANSAGPNFPPFSPTAGNDPSITPTPNQSQSSASVAEIRSDMLAQPANAEIRGANGLPIGQQPAASFPTASNQPAATPNNFDWNTKPQAQQVAAQTAAVPNTGPVLPLLLSWVLLSGSGAGNLYLFWSYLDVRNKYRDLVDEASRRISGRRIRE